MSMGSQTGTFAAPLALVATLVAGDQAAAPRGGAAKAFTLTTSSPEARAHAQEVVRRIESFQFGAQVQEDARKAVEADPQFAFGHYLMGVTAGGPAAGRPHLEKATDLARNASEAERRYIEAAVLNRQQKPVEAIAILEKLAAEYPEERMVQMLLGQIYAGQGRLDDAKARYERAIALDPGTPRAHALLGNAYLMKEDYRKAREAYLMARGRKIAGTAPGAIHYGLAMSYLYEGDVDNAVKTLETFLDEYRATRRPQDLPEVFIWNSIARVNLENGRLEEAMKAYEKGFESVRESALPEQDKAIWLGRLHHGRGRTLARMRRYDEAWKEAEKIKTMIDEGGEAGKQFLPSYHYLAGYVKLESGDYPAAIEHLKQSIPEDPFNKLLLARAYEKAGDKESAKKAYQEVVASRQNNLDRALSYNEAKKRLAAL